jgi:thioredoxin-like negative regulator of GroEL
VRKFLAKHGIQALVVDAPPAPEGAAKAAPTVDPASPDARLQRARKAASIGDVPALREALDGFPEEDERNDSAQRLLKGAEWLQGAFPDQQSAPGSIMAAARVQFLDGGLEAAMDLILESVRADRTFAGGLARQAMLLCFVVFGEDREELDTYRRQLATLLY